MSQEIKKNNFDVAIFGAGPAGIVAALKLSENGKKVIVIEKDCQLGGISKTINYKGFLLDLGPHRFFTKNQAVNKLWNDTLGEDFLPVNRLTRIYYKNKFFNYPVKAANALWGLGIWTSAQVLASYLWIKIFPNKKEDNFEQWVSNRFGYKLYSIFFKSYTEKLWGIPCQKIQAEWVAQRIKGLSMRSAIKNALFPQKNNLKTLVDKFHYPKYGSGMMYEKMAKKAEELGASFLLNHKVIRILRNDQKLSGVVVRDTKGNEEEISADQIISSIPLTNLVQQFSPKPDDDILDAAKHLRYRSTVVVNLIYEASGKPFPDNWIYVHSPEVGMLRIGCPENMSPCTVPAKDKLTLGVEYVCEENDSRWKSADEDLIQTAVRELEMLNFLKASDFSDGFVVRVPKTYPLHNTEYPAHFSKLKNFVNSLENLQVVGRYGMFKYNNMDHSILTGLYAAENILGKNHNIWEVNADEEYHETEKIPQKK